MSDIPSPCNVVPMRQRAAGEYESNESPPPLGCELLQRVIREREVDRAILERIDANVELIRREVVRLTQKTSL